jgi:hypothetical protein
MWFKGATTTNAPNIRNTIMQIIYTTKKDLIKQIESKGISPLSMNATIEDFKKYLNALNVEAKRKEVIKNVS